MSIYDQMRIIHDPDNAEGTLVPVMPLLVALNNGLIGEARTVRGASAIIIGREYLDVEDGTVEWNVRVQAARNECMKALQRNVEAVVYDSRKGIIENNYAIVQGDADYEYEENEPVGSPIKIRVENDRLFIISLIEAGSIKVYERDDSHLLRPNNKWEEERLSQGAVQSCLRCGYGIENSQGISCQVYGSTKDKHDGNMCGSYAVSNSGDLEYTGGVYIDLEKEYELTDLVGQEWLLNK